MSTPVIPSVATDLGGWAARNTGLVPPSPQVPRYARDDKGAYGRETR